MINLLPPGIRRDIIYARRNARLLRWIASLLVGVAGIVVIAGAGYVYMEHLGKDASAQANQAQADLSKQDPIGTQQQIQDLTNSLKLVIQVLSREVLFSKLLTQIGASLPAGSALRNLTIEQLKGGIDLTVGASDYQTASQVQVNLADPKNQIFSKADIVSIQCGISDPQYPCTTYIRALFAQNNPFLFINSGSTAAAK